MSERYHSTRIGASDCQIDIDSQIVRLYGYFL